MNETFNTLKTGGYNLEHNYGHGQQNLGPCSWCSICWLSPAIRSAITPWTYGA